MKDENLQVILAEARAWFKGDGLDAEAVENGLVLTESAYRALGRVGFQHIAMLKELNAAIVVAAEGISEAMVAAWSLARAYHELAVEAESPTPELTENKQAILERHIDVLRELPLEWGDQGEACDRLGITLKQMQNSLQHLRAQGLAETRHKGCWEVAF